MSSENKQHLRNSGGAVAKSSEFPVGSVAANSQGVTAIQTTKFLPRSMQSHEIDNNNNRNGHHLFKPFSFTEQNNRDYSIKSVPMMPPKIKVPLVDSAPRDDDMLPIRKPSEQLDPFSPHTGNNIITTTSSDPGSTENSRNGSFFKRFPSISLISDFNEDIWKREGSITKLLPNGDIEIIDSFGNFLGLGQRQRTPSIFFPTTTSNSPSFQKNNINTQNSISSHIPMNSVPMTSITTQPTIVSNDSVPQIPIIPWVEQNDTPNSTTDQNDFDDHTEQQLQQNTPTVKFGYKRKADHMLENNNDEKPIVGATKVDQLMLLINARKNGIIGDIKQNKEGNIIDDSLLSNTSDLVGGVEKHHIKGNKNHECKFCHKLFTQSTHLEVHIRSHMGLKPYKCEFCEKRFTQGGNLRTHMRLHTGEKPYKCLKCGKLFSRKGNLQAHELTHESKKPFICKFDHCNKEFTQLGNMKAHQNRFHLETLNKFTKRLASLDQTGIDSLPPSEMELLEYFSSLYKNLNKGIKGRGKTSRR